ncbi:hypothetical protein SAMN05428988_0136 [Chitinophaga sp. YR573]|uniref:hypothetical protein n=1 Tax=Chitinophaga sp. YR573 TaxID=1881040 RepID=UPI0008B64F64|nr:hypothetical protein [Chitinophaga sp. YR573]SEV88710.1 hypothetical protein SAMN05428988_0136 [Chitinophaga sp. YR573]
MTEYIQSIVKAVKGKRFNLQDEKELQTQIHWCLSGLTIPVNKEHNLNAKNIPDFFFPDQGIAVEVKIKGSARLIYAQCERYAGFTEVKGIILITNRSMGFPAEINGKPAYFIKLGTAWL